MNALLLLALTVFRVDPWCNTPFLPNEDPTGGVVTNEIAFAAAQGEFEAVSFVVRPDRDYEKVDVVVSELSGPDGARISADAADVTSVKVWFRPDGRWNSSWRGNQQKPEPINNLVLHDDGLVKVDWENKVNYLRGDYADGPSYMDMSHTDLKTHFENDLEPVRDASKFVPFDLKKDFRQQYLVTWKVPREAKGGRYAGTIALVSKAVGGAVATLARLAVSLEVYPFALPRPRTHYDTSEPFVSYWMGSPSLEKLIECGHRLDRAEKKMRAIFRSMVDHNAINLSGVGDLTNDSMDDYALRTLLIARQEGMCADGLINGMVFDTSVPFVCNPGGRGLLVPEAEADSYRQSLERYRAFVTKQSAILDKYLGHHRCYYSSADECGYMTNRRGYGYWNIVHELGGRTWTDYAFADLNGVFVDMNDVPAHVGAEVAWGWHASGAKAVTYASTFTGPENPDVWRRIKGLRFWYADFDGQHEYNFFDGRNNRWNDFVHYDRYCQFGIVYWTIDGLVSTLAWEAVREALDDVRYFSLLRLRAEAALKSSDAQTRQLGRAAIVWQDGVDPEYVIDLNAFRRETADWIMRLMARIGPQPADRDTELPPPAVLPPDSRWQTVPKATVGASVLFDYVKKVDDRYDLALAALTGFFGNASQPTPDRVKAALCICDLHTALHERQQAIAVIDRALAIKNITNAERGKLLLKRVDAMMANEKFEEHFTEKQLDAASETIAAALRFSGASEEERAAAIYRMVRGYFGAKVYAKAIAYAEARLKDTKLSPAHQADLYISNGECFNYMEEWEKAMKAFKEAHRVFNNDKDVNFRRQILLFEAKAAEMMKDYNRAAWCWTEMAPTYDSVEEKGKIKAARANAGRLTALARKNTKMSVGSLNEDESINSISLDE